LTLKGVTVAKRRSSRNKGLVLSAPKETTWVIAVIAGAIGLLQNVGVISLGVSAFRFVAIGFVILAIATAVRGL
jgi:hypothetical protein